jgi:ubiquinone/menaquinone biosynthesis C-methylase UbiE
MHRQHLTEKLSDTAASPYLPRTSLVDYLNLMNESHPSIPPLLDFARSGASEALTSLANLVTEFDSNETGRGDSYRSAQNDTSVRWTGMRQLLKIAAGSTRELTLLDVLGGDGTVALAAARHGGQEWTDVTVITGDCSGEMVAQALRRGLPAIRQEAQFLFLKDTSVDAALLAYGSHHIPVADRVTAVAELVRVVRPGGRIVIHDFEEDSPMARFFTEIVHVHSKSGHDYSHFTRESMAQLFRDSDSDVAVQLCNVYDPLIIKADTSTAARARMLDYVGDMYGVRDFLAQWSPGEAWALLEQCFQHPPCDDCSLLSSDMRCKPAIYQSGNVHTAEIPRIALVAVAEKRG